MDIQRWNEEKRLFENVFAGEALNMIGVTNTIDEKTAALSAVEDFFNGVGSFYNGPCTPIYLAVRRALNESVSR